MLRTISRVAVFGLLLTTLVVSHQSPVAGQAGKVQVPVFEVDASWPKLPNNWVLGGVAAVMTDRRDHVWILHRPRLVVKGQEANAAPSVL